MVHYVHYVHYVHWTSPLQTVVCFLFIFFWEPQIIFLPPLGGATHSEIGGATNRGAVRLTRLLTRFDLQIIGVENRTPSFHGFAPKCFCFFCSKWNWRYLPVGTDPTAPKGSLQRFFQLGSRNPGWPCSLPRWISLFSLRKSMAISPPFSDRARYHIAGYLPIFVMVTLWVWLTVRHGIDGP